MTPKIEHKQNGEKVFIYRFRHPVTKKPTERRIVAAKLSEADAELARLIAEMETPSSKHERIPYTKLVEQFLAEAPLTSERRRKVVKYVLTQNELNLTSTDDFNNVADLTGRCKRLLDTGRREAVYLIGHIQKFLKQLCQWAFDADLIETNGLARWRRLPFKHNKRVREPFSPVEVRAILKAATTIDKWIQPPFPLELTLRTLVTCGNRPGAVFAANVVDLLGDRIRLSPGDGKKRNGAATLPNELVAELKLATQARKPEDPLLISPRGDRFRIGYVQHDFRLTACYAFLMEVWPAHDPRTKIVEAVEVADCIARNHPRAPKSYEMKLNSLMTNPKKNKERAARYKATNELAKALGPSVWAKIGDRDFYAFCRATHIALARSHDVSKDDVNYQVGHKGGDDIERDFYMGSGTLFHPEKSCAKVYDLINMPEKICREQHILRLAAGAESIDANVNETEMSQPKTAFCEGKREVNASVISYKSQQHNVFQVKPNTPTNLNENVQNSASNGNERSWDTSAGRQKTAPEGGKASICEAKREVKLPPDLEKLAAEWSSLKPKVRAAILMMAGIE